MEYINGRRCRWFFDDQVIAVAEPKDLTSTTPFPDRPLLLIVDNWATSGWGGHYHGPDSVLYWHGYKITQVA